MKQLSLEGELSTGISDSMQMFEAQGRTAVSRDQAASQGMSTRVSVVLSC